MREAFHVQLDALVDDLVRLTLMGETAMGRATTALLQADADLANRVIADASAVAALRVEMDERALVLAARQQPVATDLRTIVGALRMTSDLERMGVLARHVAEAARRRAPACAVPDDMHATVERMGEVAENITAATRQAVATRDWHAALDLENADDEMDRLLSDLYRCMAREAPPYSVEVVADATLIGRYYERYADHAVSVARRVAYLAGHAPLDRETGHPQERPAGRTRDSAASV